jgi:hypothetical protein
LDLLKKPVVDQTLRPFETVDPAVTDLFVDDLLYAGLGNAEIRRIGRNEQI